MSGISTIVFNGSNAYELSTGHKATSWPQGAVGIEQVSAGVQLRSPTAGAGMILRIRAIASSGLLISELSQTHILTKLNDWERAEKTFTLPAGTVKIELRLVSVGGAVLFAQPKLANGSAVGAYATNFAPQLTMITPTGLYTGTVTAEQIILTGGERLPDRLLTLNANIVSLRQGINGSDAKIASLTAEMLQFSDTMSGKTSKLTADGLYTDKVTATQVKTGLLQSANNNSWINLDNGRFSFGSGALSWNGSLLQVTGRLISSGSGRTSRLSDGQFMVENGGVEVFNITNLGAAKDVNLVLGNGADRLLVSISDAAGTINDTFMIFNRSGKTIEVHKPITFNSALTINSTLKASSIYSKNGRERLAFLDDGYVGIKGGTNNVDRISIHSTYMILRDSSDRIRFNIHSTGEEIVATNGEQVFLHSGSTTALRCQNNSGHQIGVDSSGPYYMKNNSKKYF